MTHEEVLDNFPPQVYANYLEHIRYLRFHRKSPEDQQLYILKKNPTSRSVKSLITDASYLSYTKEVTLNVKLLAASDKGTYLYDMVLLPSGQVFAMKEWLAYGSIKPFRVNRKRVVRRKGDSL